MTGIERNPRGATCDYIGRGKKSMIIKPHNFANLIAVWLAFSIYSSTVRGDDNKRVGSLDRNNSVAEYGMLTKNCLKDEEIEKLSNGKITISNDGYFITVRGIRFVYTNTCWTPLLPFTE